MTLTSLYNIAECADIVVDAFALSSVESLSMMDDKECFVAINPFKIQSDADEKVKLAHELGHCLNGAFYNIYAKLDVRTKHEHTADIWAIKKLIPEDELKEASKWCRNRWELAQHFEVTEDFMQKALNYYQNEVLL